MLVQYTLHGNQSTCPKPIARKRCYRTNQKPRESKQLYVWKSVCFM